MDRRSPGMRQHGATGASRIAGIAAWLTAAVIGAAPVAHAEEVLGIDPSVRATGVGGASNAVFWGGDPNAWANPALLGYTDGIRYGMARARLFSSSSGEATFDARRAQAGIAGIGALVAGPRDVGLTRLDYGAFPSATPPAEFRRQERVDAWGLGISLTRAAAAVYSLARATPPPLLHRFDLGVGFTRMDLGAPVEAPGDVTRITDYGFFARLTPVDTFHDAPVPKAPSFRAPRARELKAGKIKDPRERMFPNVAPKVPAVPRRIDISYGYSVHDANGHDLGPATGFLPLTRVSRHGLALSISTGAPGNVSAARKAATTPLMRWAIAADLERVEPAAAAPNPAPGRYDIYHYGTEVVFSNVLSIRTGHIDGRGSQPSFGYATTSGATLGVGFRLPFRDWAGISGDWARVPRQPEFAKRNRFAFDVWVDPTAMARLMGLFRPHGR